MMSSALTVPLIAATIAGVALLLALILSSGGRRHRAATPVKSLIRKRRRGEAVHRVADDEVQSPARRTLLTATPAVGIALAVGGLAASHAGASPSAGVVKIVPEPPPAPGVGFGMNEFPPSKRSLIKPRIARKHRLHRATVKKKPAPTPRTKPVAEKIVPRHTSPTPPKPKATSPAAGSTIRDRIISNARALLGIPYVYGGESLGGMDCSGFTQYVYRKVGLRIPRVAADQYTAMRRVSRPQIGDLVFFPTSTGITHVGIYAGNGEMYAAPHTGDVIKREKIYTSNVLYATAL